MGAGLKNTFIYSNSQISGEVTGCPIGGIISYAKTIAGTPSLPVNFLECNGQAINNALSPYNGLNTPPINNNNLFLRGNTSSGGTGGAATHLHTLNISSGTDWIKNAVALESSINTASNIPPYYDIVFIMRIY